MFKTIKKILSKGDILASAKVITGDQIIVNKLIYNFRSPEEEIFLYLILKTSSMMMLEKIHSILREW